MANRIAPTVDRPRRLAGPGRHPRAAHDGIEPDREPPFRARSTTLHLALALMLPALLSLSWAEARAQTPARHPTVGARLRVSAPTLRPHPIIGRFDRVDADSLWLFVRQPGHPLSIPVASITGVELSTHHPLTIGALVPTFVAVPALALLGPPPELLVASAAGGVMGSIVRSIDDWHPLPPALLLPPAPETTVLPAYPPLRHAPRLRVVTIQGPDHALVGRFSGRSVTR